MGKGMKAGKKPKKPGAGGNMQKQLQQAQVMQQKMLEAQEQINEMESSATAGGGAVTARVNGKKELLELTLKPEIVDPDDIEMLQDLVIAAVNEALRQMDEISEQEMGKVTGAFGMPAGLL